MQMLSCPGLPGVVYIKEVIDQRIHNFHCSLPYVLQSRALVTSPPTFKKPVDDLKASTEVRQRKLIEFSPTLDKAQRRGE